MKSNKFIIYFTVILTLVFVNITTYAAVIRVPVEQPTIQAGIDAARDGDTVLVADGVYKGEGNVNIDFKGKPITLKSQNGADSTIIDALKQKETRGFIFRSQETNNSVLDGFTIKNGRHKVGGGIFCNLSSPTIKNCIITHNRATSTTNENGGGGIYSIFSYPLISDCKIVHNIADSDNGAGIYLSQRILRTFERSTVLPPPNIINCDISQNNGVGIYCNRSTPIIKDCTILQNNKEGIVCYYLSVGVVIDNCRIEQNAGGVLCTTLSHLDIIDSIIKRNSALNGGGISCSDTSVIKVSRSVIVENHASRHGGGIFFNSKQATAEISQCTITQNTALETGGGIFAESNNLFKLTDSIIWDNKSQGTHPEVFIAQFGGRIIIRSCDIRGGIKGMGIQPDGLFIIFEDNIDSDPLFLDVEIGDYRLMPNSPAATMGAPSHLVNPFSVNSFGKKLVLWGELKSIR